MKCLFTSDWHIDAITAGQPRLPEFASYIDAINHEGPFDYVFFLGDACDPGARLGPRYSAALIDAANALHESTKRGSVWIAGNHDVIESEEVFTSLSPVKSAMVHHDSFTVAERPTFLDLGTFGLLCLPYVSRAYERTDAYHADLGDAFGAALEFENPIGVISHLTVPGAKLGSESKELARGRDVDFPSHDVARLEPLFVTAGHYHNSQIVNLHGLEIIIIGSPHRFTFGERRDLQKGFLVMDF